MVKQYIDKSVVMAEIESRIASLENIGLENYLHDNYPEQYAMLVTLKSLKFSLDTLEVKEVDFEKLLEDYGIDTDPFSTQVVSSNGGKIIAKHFFELGMAVGNKAQEKPVSEDLEEFALQYAGHHAPYDSCMQEVEDAVKAGAKWQKEQLMKDAVYGLVCGHDESSPAWIDLNLLNKPNVKVGTEVKLIIIKDE